MSSDFVQEQCNYWLNEQMAAQIKRRMRETGLAEKGLSYATGYEFREVQRFLNLERPMTLHFAGLACGCLGLRISLKEKKRRTADGEERTGSQGA